MCRNAKLRGDGRVERLVFCDIMMLGLLRLVVLCFYGRWRLMAGATAFRLGLFPGVRNGPDCWGSGPVSCRSRRRRYARPSAGLDRLVGRALQRHGLHERASLVLREDDRKAVAL